MTEIDLDNLTLDQLDYLEARKTPAHMGHWLTGGYYRKPRHVVYLSDLLADELTAGDARIIVCAPPRHGKSELIDVQVPTWCQWKAEEWGLPDFRVILAGHSAGFAATWGRKTRDYICEHRGKLGIDIVGGVDAAMDEWRTTRGGGMRCAGVGVGITGLGANLFIIDDPTPDSKAAYSPTHQQDLKDWYQGVVDRRLEPHASIIVTMQRWPGVDFVSWLKSLVDQGKLRFKIINLAALYCRLDPLGGPGPAHNWEDPIGRNPDANNGLGEALWPERWDEKALVEKAKTSDDEAFWHSQYQQRPPDNSGIGLSYHSFSVQRCVKPMQYNPRLPLLLTCDFNVDPMCWCICQEEVDHTKPEYNIYTNEKTPDIIRKKINVLDEVYLRNTTTQAACAEFVKKVQRMIDELPTGMRPKGNIDVYVHGDASGHHKKTTSPTDYRIIEEELRATKMFHVKIAALRSNPGQRDRVNIVNNALCNTAGECRLFINVRCVELRKDFLQMKWMRNAKGEALNDLDDGDPMRGHISDGLGYLVWKEMKMSSQVGGNRDRLL